jgi:hypothetical protein
LGVVRRASYSSTEKENKLKNLNVQNRNVLKGIDGGEDYGIRIQNFIFAPGYLIGHL